MQEGAAAADCGGAGPGGGGADGGLVGSSADGVGDRRGNVCVECGEQRAEGGTAAEEAGAPGPGL